MCGYRFLISASIKNYPYNILSVQTLLSAIHIRSIDH